MDLVEKVARAICEARERNGGPPYDGFDAVHGERAARRLREHLFEEAEAAIKALRESTPQMLDAPAMKDWAWRTDERVDPKEIADAWRSMIDAALASHAGQSEVKK